MSAHSWRKLTRAAPLPFSDVERLTESEKLELLQNVSLSRKRNGAVPMDAKSFGGKAYVPPPTFAPGVRVRYTCEPPIYGTVLRTDGEGTYIEALGFGELRCATRDLRVCGEGE